VHHTLLIALGLDSPNHNECITANRTTPTLVETNYDLVGFPRAIHPNPYSRYQPWNARFQHRVAFDCRYNNCAVRCLQWPIERNEVSGIDFASRTERYLCLTILEHEAGYRNTRWGGKYLRSPDRFGSYPAIRIRDEQQRIWRCDLCGNRHLAVPSVLPQPTALKVTAGNALWILLTASPPARASPQRRGSCSRASRSRRRSRRGAISRAARARR
jgi:hypothetical protein